MKLKIVLAVQFAMLFSCSRNNGGNEKIDYNFIESTIDFILEQKDNNTVELISFHDSSVSIVSNENNERIILSETLKKKGFKTINFSQGKIPPNGPIITSITLQRENCICLVDKLYYTSNSEPGYEVTERITCSDSLTYQRAR